MKLKRFVWMYLLAAGILSCVSEEMAEDTSLGDDYATLQIPLLRSGGVADDERIATARLVVCRTTGARDVLVNEYRTAPQIAFDVLVPVGYVDLYLIANEQAYWDLGQTSSSGQLKGAIQRYAGYPPVDADHPIPMLGKYENLYIDSDGSTSINGSPVRLDLSAEGTVERIFAKVTLHLHCRFAEQPNNGDPIAVKSVSVKRLPKGSYLSPARYREKYPDGFFDGANAPPGDYLHTSDGFDGSSTFYIPEYIADAPDLYGYLSVTVGLRDDPAAEREYRIVIGDGVKDPSHDNDYMLGETKSVADITINRNTHYIFDARIVSFNLSGEYDVELHPSVAVWKREATRPDIPPACYLTVSQSEIILPANALPCRGVIVIDTDHPEGWSAYSQSSAVRLDGAPLTHQYPGRLSFTVTQPVDAIIEVSAGNITKYVRVRVAGDATKTI